MPCSDGRDHVDWRDVESAQLAADENARMACEACIMIEALLAGEEIHASNELRKWWYDHKLRDAIRKNIVANYKRCLP